MTKREAAADAAGAILAASLVGWTWLTAPPGTDPRPLAALVGAVALSYAISRVASTIWMPLVPLAVVAAAGVLAVRDVSGPGHAPLSYGNANASFFVVALAAALMVAGGARRLVEAFVGVAAAAFFLAVIVGAGSAAAVALAVVVGVTILAREPRAVRVTVAACAVLFLSALGATLALGAAYSPTTRSGPAYAAASSGLTERRLALWSEAEDLVVRNPVRGVGPGRFEEASPTARSDPDARWAHHEFLEVGAESGVVALILAAALVVWGFGRLYVTSSPSRVTAVAAGALAAVGVHACVDYVLHFPVIPVTLAGLVAAGSSGWARSTAGT